MGPMPKRRTVEGSPEPQGVPLQRLRSIAATLGRLRRSGRAAKFEKHSDLWLPLLGQARVTAYLLEAGAFDAATVLRLRNALATYDATQELDRTDGPTADESAARLDGAVSAEPRRNVH